MYLNTENWGVEPIHIIKFSDLFLVQKHIYSASLKI